MDIGRLRRRIAGLALPKAAHGRLVLAVDVSPWLRPDAATCPDRSFCHTYGRGEAKHQMIPGWPYSVVAALETGRTSWTAVLDAIRLQPGGDLAAVTTVQLREIVDRLIAAGQWREGDPEILIVLDSGYDAPRIAHLLAGLPVEILGRLRSDRVMRRPTPPRVYNPKGGRPPKHGGEFVFGQPNTWGAEQAVTVTDTRLYGKATAQAWDRLHPRLTRRAAWADYEGALPVIEGTIIRLVVEKLPSGGVNKPVWLWWSGTGATAADVDRCWQSFLRRFDVEHTFRLFKQTLGWTKPRLRSPRGRRSLDVAGDRRSHPAPARPSASRRPAAAVGEEGRAEQAHPGQSPPGVPEPPREDALPGACTETHHARPRPPTRLQEPPTGTTPRRGTRPGHRRGTHSPRPPQEGHQAPPNAIDEQPNTSCCHDAPHGS